MEAVYLCAILPLLAEKTQPRYLFYYPGMVVLHSVVFTLQSMVVVGTQFALLHRSALFTEGLPYRSWDPVVPSAGKGMEIFA